MSSASLLSSEMTSVGSPYGSALTMDDSATERCCCSSYSRCWSPSFTCHPCCVCHTLVRECNSSKTTSGPDSETARHHTCATKARALLASARRWSRKIKSIQRSYRMSRPLMVTLGVLWCVLLVALPISICVAGLIKMISDGNDWPVVLD